MEIIVTGGHLVKSGNILIKTRNVSWIQSNVGFGPALNPSALSMDMQRSAVARSGLGAQSLYSEGVTNGQGLLPGLGFVATSILSLRQAQWAPYKY